MAEKRPTQATPWGSVCFTPHLTPNNVGPTRESEKEGIQEDVIPTNIIRLRRSGTGMNGEPSKDYDHGAVLCQRQEGRTDVDRTHETTTSQEEGVGEQRGRTAGDRAG